MDTHNPSRRRVPIMDIHKVVPRHKKQADGGRRASRLVGLGQRRRDRRRSTIVDTHNPSRGAQSWTPTIRRGGKCAQSRTRTRTIMDTHKAIPRRRKRVDGGRRASRLIGLGQRRRDRRRSGRALDRVQRPLRSTAAPHRWRERARQGSYTAPRSTRLTISQRCPMACALCRSACGLPMARQ